MSATSTDVRVPTQSEILRILTAAQKAGLEVFGYVVNGSEMRVITKDKEPPGDEFDMVDFTN